MTGIKAGFALWSQASTWPWIEHAAAAADSLGYDHLWTWDHLLPIRGTRSQNTFEGWSLLTGIAMATQRAHLGLLVTANTFRNPAVTAKIAATVDHISDGRAILGIGSGWFEPEHIAYGIPFGSGFGERIAWLDQSLEVMRALLAGDVVTTDGGHYQINELRQLPVPVQARIPIMIGGIGDKTLRLVARHADMWNALGDNETLRERSELLTRNCEAIGRDPNTIERTVGFMAVIRDDPAEAMRVWTEQMEQNHVGRDEWEQFLNRLWFGPPELVRERVQDALSAGFNSVILAMPAPYDMETIERFMTEVKPLLTAV